MAFAQKRDARTADTTPGDACPVLGFHELHVLGQRVRVHGNFRMIVPSEKFRAF